MAFGILTAVAVSVARAPGGNYRELDVAAYVSIGHLPAVIVSGYLALLGVFGLICLLAYLRQAISVEPGREFAAAVFWGAGLASAASLAVSWGLLSGIAVAAAEGGSGNPGNAGAAASFTPAETYLLSDTSGNVLYGSGGILLGFALIALGLGSRGSLPNWLRRLTMVAGVLAIGSPALFPAFVIPIWAVVIGIRLLVVGRRPLAAAAVEPAGVAA